MAEQLRLIARKVDLFGENELCLVLEYVFRNVQQYGTGSTCQGHMDCFPHRAGDVLSVQHQTVILSDRDSYTSDIDFWKASLPMKNVLTWPVMANTGTESR